MKVLIDVPDKKADFIIEVLHNFSFIKTTTITPIKAELLKDLKDSIEEVNSFKKGKMKLKNAKDFIKSL
ncbi:MAG: hypothetical protein SFU98_05145 [Leptospiraceae bacterium]|nr:hypothetical protein [Leptospiraceae bacterium]